MILHIENKQQFDSEVSNGITLVDFFATWCGPCKMLSPVLEGLAASFEGKVKFIKVDVDKVGAVAQQFGIMSIPTLVLIKDGKPVATTMGYMGADDLTQFINSNI